MNDGCFTGSLTTYCGLRHKGILRAKSGKLILKSAVLFAFLGCIESKYLRLKKSRSDPTSKKAWMPLVVTVKLERSIKCVCKGKLPFLAL